MDNKETNQQLETEFIKQNEVIAKLQIRIGQLEGKVARLETENEWYRQYVLQQEQNKEKNKEEKEEK